MGVADALLGGATYSTADTVRPALQLIKTKPGNSIVSFLLQFLVRPSATGENEVLAMGDCAINIHPTEDELVEIAGESAECAKIFGVDPKVAFLSYSTLGSGKGEDVDKMRNAAAKAKGKKLSVSSDRGRVTVLMQQYPRVLHVPSARATKWQDMQTPLFSRTLTPEISVTRLHSVLVISRHMVRSCLA